MRLQRMAAWASRQSVFVSLFVVLLITLFARYSLMLVASFNYNIARVVLGYSKRLLDN